MLLFSLALGKSAFFTFALRKHNYSFDFSENGLLNEHVQCGSGDFESF